MKKIFGICFFVLMTGCILTHSSLSLAYAALGLNLWYEKMVPVLLPFMILSGTLIRMGMTDSLIRPVSPLFGRIFRLPGPGIYVILVGFLCGFPMGARTIADLRNRQELSSEEGQYLLAFCNNLGPVFLGFVLPLLHRKLVLPYVFGMYGIPLLYGISLRYSVYRNRIPEKTDQAFGRDDAAKLLEQTDPACLPAISLPDALDDAITAAGRSILQLGGYMIFFNLLNLLPRLLVSDSFRYAPLWEISGGLKLLGDRFPLYTLLLLPFGGLSCIAQTGSCIRNTGLSLKSYILHKMVRQCLLQLIIWDGFCCLRILFCFDFSVFVFCVCPVGSGITKRPATTALPESHRSPEKHRNSLPDFFRKAPEYFRRHRPW